MPKAGNGGAIEALRRRVVVTRRALMAGDPFGQCGFFRKHAPKGSGLFFRVGHLQDLVEGLGSAAWTA